MFTHTTTTLNSTNNTELFEKVKQKKEDRVNHSNKDEFASAEQIQKWNERYDEFLSGFGRDADPRLRNYEAPWLNETVGMFTTRKESGGLNLGFVEHSDVAKMAKFSAEYDWVWENQVVFRSVAADQYVKENKNDGCGMAGFLKRIELGLDEKPKHMWKDCRKDYKEEYMKRGMFRGGVYLSRVDGGEMDEARKKSYEYTYNNWSEDVLTGSREGMSEFVQQGLEDIHSVFNFRLEEGMTKKEFRQGKRLMRKVMKSGEFDFSDFSEGIQQSLGMSPRLQGEENPFGFNSFSTIESNPFFADSAQGMSDIYNSL